MKVPPAPGSSPFDKLATPEAKIAYIQNSKVPGSEKKHAIEMIRSGKR